MKRLTFCMAVVATMALVGTAWAGKDKEESQCRLEIDLTDGSHVIGTTDIESIPMQTPYAKLDIALKQILTIKIEEDHEKASIDLRNGDKLKGVINLAPIELGTIFGTVKIGIEHIQSITATPGGGLNYTILEYGSDKLYKGICAGDIDKDGKVEVIAGNKQDGTFEIWGYDEASAKMVRKDVVAFMTDSKPYPHSVAFADLDKDGNNDLVVCYEFSGLFTAMKTPKGWVTKCIDGTYGSQVLVADFDLDGNPDILLATAGGGLKIFYGKGDGAFIQGPGPALPSGEDSAGSFSIVDLNGAGRPDLIGSSGQVGASYSLVAYVNTAADGQVKWVEYGSHNEPAASFLTARTSESVCDWYGNGHVNKLASQNGGRIVIWAGDKDATGKPKWTLTTLDTLSDLTAGGDFLVGARDLNNDGYTDIYASGFSLFKGLVVYVGAGQGRYNKVQVSLDYGIGNPESLATGDFNGDGLTDIVADKYNGRDQTSGGFVVLLQKPWKAEPLQKKATSGPLAFGGVNWTPWRMLFEVQGDKLVSLPKARPGFNYGHNGNGRGPVLVANVGSKEWKDYIAEFDFCMSGVDASFNPYGLPLTYRNGSIMFHVVDARESFNERGATCYVMNFEESGAWNLRCTYNEYCAVSSGYGNPTSDGGRTLAKGQGLKLDAVVGNTFRIEVRGTHIQILLDGEKIVDVTDEKMGEIIGGQTLDHGGMGFVWGMDSMGWIRNFSVKKL